MFKIEAFIKFIKQRLPFIIKKISLSLQVLESGRYLYIFIKYFVINIYKIFRTDAVQRYEG